MIEIENKLPGFFIKQERYFDNFKTVYEIPTEQLRELGVDGILNRFKEEFPEAAIYAQILKVEVISPLLKIHN